MKKNKSKKKFSKVKHARGKFKGISYFENLKTKKRYII